MEKNPHFEDYKKKKLLFVKILASVLAISMISNLVLFVTRMINPYFFWLTTIVIALIAYKGIPYLMAK